MAQGSFRLGLVRASGVQCFVFQFQGFQDLGWRCGCWVVRF